MSKEGGLTDSVSVGERREQVMGVTVVFQNPTGCLPSHLSQCDKMMIMVYFILSRLEQRALPWLRYFVSRYFLIILLCCENSRQQATMFDFLFGYHRPGYADSYFGGYDDDYGAQWSNRREKSGAAEKREDMVMQRFNAIKKQVKNTLLEKTMVRDC